MNKKTILLLGIIAILILGILILNPFKQKNIPSASISGLSQPTQLTASKTLKGYSDPSGFSFTYPDNLSLLNNDLKDNNSYAELQLAAKGLDGSLLLKIADSKFNSLDEWIKLNKTSQTPKEVKLGNLKALEITTDDKLLLGALNQGVFFNIEVPIKNNKDFWMEVYKQVLADFSFAPPPQADTSSSDDVTFDGEEVVQ